MPEVGSLNFAAIKNLLETDEALVSWLLKMKLDVELFEINDPARCVIAQFLESLRCYSIFTNFWSVRFCLPHGPNGAVHFNQWATKMQEHFVYHCEEKEITPRQILWYLRGENYRSLLVAAGKEEFLDKDEV